MSEIGIILNEYDSLAETTDRINNAIIILKKHKVISSGNPGGEKLNVSEEELNLARNALSGFMDYMMSLNTKKGTATDYTIIPQRVVERFRNEKVEFFQSNKKLQAIRKTINANQPLDEEQFKLLDAIVTYLDMARSILFKKLRTARG